MDIKNLDDILTITQQKLNITLDRSQIYRLSTFITQTQCDPVLIEKACDAALISTKPKNFSYVLGILRNWVTEGIKTLDDYNIHIAPKTHNTNTDHNKTIKNSLNKYSVVANELDLNRKLTYFEEAVVESWSEGYSLSLDQIIIFCKIIRKKAKYPTIKYCDIYINDIMRDDTCN